ncbi:MarR family transcriptional regulator [Verrucosispora sp. WMMA2044]|uniref:arsenate reductase/protein-tyrosine-phosphatase family protein n=1 Tax=Verrucosispora sp. WMMA2044 TaxID=3016419 RepID=UPI00248C2AAA|nr:MarR family transcriptional regulator [Verrucosispora sp. WMMA2044]WBB50435.1 MarR family transcriptional regulator [Verrucosispora sp. WMMA2044]
MYPVLNPEPPGVLRLTAHPVRWRLLTELARSDRQVRELMELIGQQQSLTSYHLGQLRAGGLVTVRRSSADKRDSYYSLNLRACRDLLAEAGASLHPGLRLVPATLAPPGPDPGRPDGSPVRVIFLCTGNSSRSQMAEAILQQMGGARVAVASAGGQPKPLHPNTVRVMGESGIDMTKRRPKHLSDFLDQRFDYVISLCDRLREVCPDFPRAGTVLHWSVPDPAGEVETAEESYAQFQRTAEELRTRVEFLLHAIDHAASAPEGADVVK